MGGACGKEPAPAEETSPKAGGKAPPSLDVSEYDSSAGEAGDVVEAVNLADEQSVEVDPKAIPNSAVGVSENDANSLTPGGQEERKGNDLTPEKKEGEKQEAIPSGGNITQPPVTPSIRKKPMTKEEKRAAQKASMKQKRLSIENLDSGDMLNAVKGAIGEQRNTSAEIKFHTVLAGPSLFADTHLPDYCPLLPDAEFPDMNSIQEHFNEGKAWYARNDMDNAKLWFMSAADGGHATAMATLAAMQADKDNDEDSAPNDGKSKEMQEKAIHGFGQFGVKALADAGDADALWAMALMAFSCDGDVMECASFFRKAADLGHTQAALSLGMAVPQPQFTAESRKRRDSIAGSVSNNESDRETIQKAVDWTTTAAIRGHPHAEFLLGTMYLTGAGVTRNLALTKKLWSHAAEQGHGQAKLALTTTPDLQNL